ncbi:MAG TPA: multicopper oxidase domain-containing protein [Nitrospirota bacterium]
MFGKFKILAALSFFASIALTPWSGTTSFAAQVQLPGSDIPQFIDPLPALSVQGGPVKTIVAGPCPIEIHMREFKASVMPSTFVPSCGRYTGTWVWGYINGPNAPVTIQGTYIGPVIVATRGVPTQIKFMNDLGSTDTTNLTFWKNSVDQTLHWADPLNGQMNMCNHDIMPGMGPMGNCGQNYSGPIPAVPHLHGGEIPPVLDGGPDAWFLSGPPNKNLFPDAKMHGNTFYSKDGNTTGNYQILRYPNAQEAAPIWFHDHVLGITRLNVYAGLAGAYLVTDPKNPPPANLQKPADIVPLVLQDRMFDAEGQLFFPNTGINPEHPFWIPEFVGDTIVVNGKVWPFFNVQPKRYRFLLINGSNARTYELDMVNQADNTAGPAIWQIETDGGYLDKPVQIGPNNPRLKKLLMMPGERAGVIIDFSKFAGKTLILHNTGNTPYPGGVFPDPATLGKIVQFRVAAVPVVDNSYNPASGTPLRTAPIVRLVTTSGATAAGVTVNKRRQLTLNEVQGPGGPLEILVNNTDWDGRRPDRSIRKDFTPVTINGVTAYYSELPKEGDTEVWEIVNLTMDAHPIHTHLTQFQLLRRQNFDVDKYSTAYASVFPGGTFKGITYLPGMYIPGFGPPLNYNSGNCRALGGNPDITPFLLGSPEPARPNEFGWKDTIMAPPGMVTRFVVRYAPMDKKLNDPNLFYPFHPAAAGRGYVWHCHIIDHEDNEMMRPYKVIPKPGVARTYRIGIDY